MSRRELSDEGVAAVAEVVDAVWAIRDSDGVETGANGWPTTAAIVSQCEYCRGSVTDALRTLADRGDVDYTHSIRIGDGTDLKTVAPTDRDDDDCLICSGPTTTNGACRRTLCALREGER